MHRYVHTTIKMSLSALITTLIANALSLDNAITAGILAVLSMQLTRTDSFLMAFKRYTDTLLALALGTFMFYFLGYELWVFFIYTPIFIGLSFALKVNEGIVPALVLASHLLGGGQFSTEILFNALAIITIAILVALTLNIIYPLNTMKVLKISNDEIDELLRTDIYHIGKALKNRSEFDHAKHKHNQHKSRLEAIIKEAELSGKDILFDKDRRYIAYLKTRSSQMRRISRIIKLMDKIESDHPHAKEIGHYLENLSSDIGHVDKATSQKEALNELLTYYRNQALPTTRNAFEVRAILFQILFEIESFLNAKIDFHKMYPDFQ